MMVVKGVWKIGFICRVEVLMKNGRLVGGRKIVEAFVRIRMLKKMKFLLTHRNVFETEGTTALYLCYSTMKRSQVYRLSSYN